MKLFPRKKSTAATELPVLVNADGTLTDQAVASAVALVRPGAPAVVSAAGVAAADVLVFGGAIDVGASLVFCLGALAACIWAITKVWAPWEGAVFMIYFGIDTRELPESGLQIRIRSFLARRQTRLKAGMITAIGLLVPWAIGLASTVVAWKGVAWGRDVTKFWFMLLVLGILTGLACNVFAVLGLAAAAKRIIPEGVHPIEGTGSTALALRLHGISKKRAWAWFFIGLVAVSAYGYCRGLSIRHERERAAASGSQPGS
jgi:hypothetical protein